MTCVDRPSFLIKKNKLLSRMFTVKGVVWPVGRARKKLSLRNDKTAMSLVLPAVGGWSPAGVKRTWPSGREKKKYIIMRSKYALTDPSHGSHPSTCSRILVPAERLFKLSSHTHTKEIRRRLSVSRVCMLREVRSSFFPHFISQSKKETGSLQVNLTQEANKT